MKTKLLIGLTGLLFAFGCGDRGDSSNMDKATDSMNTMTTYPSGGDSGTYGSSADSSNYNNRNISADDSAGIRKPGTSGDTGVNR